LKIIFYTTVGCHLCDNVAPMLDHVKADFALEISVIDIADDDHLIELYGQEIPVLYRPDLDMDIAWPFNLENLQAFLAYQD